MSDDAFKQTRRILESLRDDGAPPKVLVALANLTRIETSWNALKDRILVQRATDLSTAYVEGQEDMREAAAACVLSRPIDDCNADIAAAIRALPVRGDGV